MSEQNNNSSEETVVTEPNSSNGTQDSSSEVATLKTEVEKFKNEYMYLRADFENYKKNSIKERSDYLRFGNERLVVELLGVVDNFERALETQVNAENFKDFVKGVELTAAELRSVLKKFGVADVAAHAVPFDPMVHEAIGSEETSTMPPGHIFRVFKKPYKLHDKLIRPGQVVVAKAKADA